MSKYVYGIDLGTTYSCIAYQDENGRPVVLKNLDGDSTTPSVVQFPDEGSVIVGKNAKGTSVMHPDHTIAFVKRLMGVEKVAYRNRNGEDISPSEISSYILDKVAKDAGKMNDDTVTDVVITCPAYFGENEREATKEAGRLAGLNVLAIIEEPTAAAVYYGCTRNADDKTVLIYDLGGGTFDITVMKISDGEVRVICTDGNHSLGGKDWDDALKRYFMEVFLEQTDYDGEFDTESLQDLTLLVEDAKISLSQRPSVKKMMYVQGVRASIEITQEQFEEITVPTLLSSTISLTKSAIEVAKTKGVTNIDEILLVGGSSKMPQVLNAIKENFGIEPKILEPDEAVAKGAAIYAILMRESSIPSFISDDESKDIIETKTDESTGDITYVVEDVETGQREEIVQARTMSLAPAGGAVKVISASTKSFGIKVIMNEIDRIYNMILKDNELPIIVTEGFSTHDDGQESVAIQIFESTIATKDYAVDQEFYKGEAILPLPPNTPAGTPISITMELSNDGTLKIRGVNPQTGEECRGEFQSDCILNKDEFEKARSRVTALAKTIE